MPNATLDATVFNGRPGNHATRTAPKKATRTPYKVGVAHTGADGTINSMLGNNGDVRNVFVLEWENVGPVTRTAVQAAFGISVPFNYTDEDGNSWAVQCLFNDYEEEHVDSIPNAGAVIKLYNITLTMRD